MFNPAMLTPQERRFASRAVVEASNRVFALDRSALGSEYELVLAFAYGEVEELLQGLASAILTDGRQIPRAS